MLFYLTCTRPITEYACPVFHNSLPQYLAIDLERCQRRALRIIFPSSSYEEALLLAGLVPLYDRRQQITDKLFQDIRDPEHKLNRLLPPMNSCTVNLRRKRSFAIKAFKTDRLKNSFIIYNSLQSKS